MNKLAKEILAELDKIEANLIRKRYSLNESLRELHDAISRVTIAIDADEATIEDALIDTIAVAVSLSAPLSRTDVFKMARTRARYVLRVRPRGLSRDGRIDPRVAIRLLTDLGVIERAAEDVTPTPIYQKQIVYETSRLVLDCVELLIAYKRVGRVAPGHSSRLGHQRRQSQPCATDAPAGGRITTTASDSLDKAIAAASSLTVTYHDVERMTEAERLGHLIELTGQVIRDPAQENTLLPIVASAAMQWAGDVVEGSDPPHWARQTALQDADDAQATRLGRASHLTASVAHLAKIIADEDAASADQLGTALINAAVAALAWLTDITGANVDVPRPASDDYLARVSEEILSILDQSPTLRNLDADPFALPDLAEAITDQLDMGGWLTPPLPTDPRTQEHTA